MHSRLQKRGGLPSNIKDSGVSPVGYIIGLFSSQVGMGVGVLIGFKSTLIWLFLVLIDEIRFGLLRGRVEVIWFS